MTVDLAALEFDALSPRALTQFWGLVLGRQPSRDGVTLPAVGDTDFRLRFVPTDVPKAGPHRMHFDLTSDSLEDQQARVELAVSLGATHLDVGKWGDESHVVLADPEGNEFCVIEPGNHFLTNTARIGALAGDGARDVGYFWRDLLRWPLVWDQDEETAIQAPRGGTKLTWGGPPVASKQGRNRLRWVLEGTAPLKDEVDRACALGAVVLTAAAVPVELADPEGNEFLLTQKV